MESDQSRADETTILQRCRATIESLHQQLICLGIVKEKDQLEIESLKKTISQKNLLIKELGEKIERLESYSKSRKREAGDASENGSHLMNKLSHLLAQNRQRSKQIGRPKGETPKFPQSSLGLENLNQVQSNVMSSKHLESELNIKMSELLSRDKRTLVSIIQQKQREIQSLRKQNKQLIKERNKLAKYCKSVIRKISSEHQIDPRLISGQCLREKRMKTLASEDKPRSYSSVSSKKLVQKPQLKRNLNDKKLLVRNSKQSRSKTQNEEHTAPRDQCVYYTCK